MSEVLKRRKFIELFLAVIRKDLEEQLPDEDFEDSLLEKAWAIMCDKTRHVRRAMTGRE
jgi:hypothetical protein